MDIAEIRQRVRAIRLPQCTLADLVRIEKNTVSRVLLGKTDPRNSTVSSLIDGVTAEELRLRDYLLALHPLPEQHHKENAA